MEARALLAIFVGGKSSRMGTPKGLLQMPGASETILEALLRVARESRLEPVLVGEASPYGHLAEGVTRIHDEPQGAGPLGGLHAALRYASRKGYAQLVAVACDMPYLSSEALRQVVDHSSAAILLAPRRGPDAPWEPMLARYDAVPLVEILAEAIDQGVRSFQKLFASIEVDALPLSPALERALEDWDSPEDLPG